MGTGNSSSDVLVYYGLYLILYVPYCCLSWQHLFLGTDSLALSLVFTNVLARVIALLGMSNIGTDGCSDVLVDSAP